ncbi:hypothetical protein T484DRAFT_3645903, partial [Baffinella frigidus]
NPKPQTPNPKPHTPHPTPHAPHPKPRTSNPKPETRNPKPETRNPRPETRNPKPETRNPKPETRNAERGRDGIARAALHATDGRAVLLNHCLGGVPGITSMVQEEAVFSRNPTSTAPLPPLKSGNRKPSICPSREGWRIEGVHAQSTRGISRSWRGSYAPRNRALHGYLAHKKPPLPRTLQ